MIIQLQTQGCVTKTDFCSSHGLAYNAAMDACEDSAGATTPLPEVVKRITPSEVRVLYPALLSNTS